MKDVLTEAMDIEGLKYLLRGMQEGRIRCLAVDTPVPSQFSHEILNANPYAYLDDAPLEERRARAVEMRRILPESVLEEVGKLDPAAIAQVREEAWPDVRDADELHDVLHTLIAFPEPRGDSRPRRSRVQLSWHAGSEFGRPLKLRTESAAFFRTAEDGCPTESQRERMAALFREIACTQGRAVRAEHGGAHLLGRGGTGQDILPVFPDAGLIDQSADIQTTLPSPDDACWRWSRAGCHIWVRPPLRNSANISGFPPPRLKRRCFAWKPAERCCAESSLTLPRGRMAPAPHEEHEWCERRLLARIHRLTVATLRKQIEPVTAAQFMRWLLRWQHVAPEVQVQGERATLEVLRQLQGFEIPANAWERQILGRRIANYDPKWLDQLCLTGAVGWGRLSPHPATLDDTAAGKRRVIPTSVAPITFFVREEADWMTPHRPDQLAATSPKRAV